MNTAKIMKFERPEVPTEGKCMEGGFIQIPNEVYRAGKRFLKGNDLRVFLEIVDKTYGYGKQEDDMTIQQIANELGMYRQNASTAYNKLLEQGVIYAKKGKYGFVTGINPVSEWKVKNHATALNSCAENNATALNSCEPPHEIHAHKIQLPKDNISSLSSSLGGLTTEGGGGDEKTKLPAKPKTKKKTIAPVDDIVAAYNEIAGSHLPTVQTITDERRKTLNARWLQFLNTTDQLGRVRYHDNESGLKWWKSFFRKVLLNDRWTGASGLAWTADFDWIVKKSNFVKILEWRPAQHGGNGNAH